MLLGQTEPGESLEEERERVESISGRTCDFNKSSVPPRRALTAINGRRM